MQLGLAYHLSLSSWPTFSLSLADPSSALSEFRAGREFCLRMGTSSKDPFVPLADGAPGP